MALPVSIYLSQESVAQTQGSCKRGHKTRVEEASWDQCGLELCPLPRALHQGWGPYWAWTIGPQKLVQGFLYFPPAKVEHKNDTPFWLCKSSDLVEPHLWARPAYSFTVHYENFPEGTSVASKGLSFHYKTPKEEPGVFLYFNGGRWSNRGRDLHHKILVEIV